MGKAYIIQKEGTISIEHMPDELECDPGYIDGHFDLQVATDGRVWINVNGVCLLRFKPNRLERGKNAKLDSNSNTRSGSRNYG